MSCDAAALAFALHLASLDASQGAPRLIPAIAAPPPRVSALSREPLFASIVGDAKRLQGEVGAMRKAPAPAAGALDQLDTRLQALAALDMKGHVELAARGTDGDLKCILKGISQDLPRKLAAVRAAGDPAGRRSALDELWYLLRDNVEVVTTPSQVQSSDAAAAAS